MADRLLHNGSMKACTAAVFGFSMMGTLGWSADLPTAEQIGERAGIADAENTSLVRAYTVTRRYVLDTPRFNKHAEMTVRVTYRPDLGKKVEIVSSQNADGIQKRVFQRVIEAEQESSTPEHVEAMRISPRNYSFRLLGTEQRDGFLCYVLELKPKRKSKFLIEGKAWINTEDYGLVHVEGRPAERISFWVGKPEFSQSFCKVGPAWMLSSNHSTAEVKLFGKSELAIDSFNFKVQYMDHDQLARATSPGSRNHPITE
jgi:hypothetical protein